MRNKKAYRYPVYLTFLVVCLTACWLGSETWNGKAKRLGFIEKQRVTWEGKEPMRERPHGDLGGGRGHEDDTSGGVLQGGEGVGGPPSPLLRWPMMHCADRGI